MGICIVSMMTNKK